MQNRELSQPFIFNPGRIWQSALCDDWSEAERICRLIEETGIVNSGLKRVKTAVLKEDIDDVDEGMNEILKW